MSKMQAGKTYTVPTSMTVEKAQGLPYGSFEAVIATEDLDRQGEKMSIPGIQMPRKNYKIYYNHTYNGGQDLPIGVWEDLWTKGKKLMGRGRLFVKSYDFARQVYDIMLDGGLDSTSIGFIPEEWDDSKSMWTKSQFVEASIVAEPANVAALVTAKKLDITTEQVMEMEKDFELQVRKDAGAMADANILEVKAMIEDLKSSVGTVESLLSGNPVSKQLIKVRVAAKQVGQQADSLNQVIKVKLKET